MNTMITALSNKDPFTLDGSHILYKVITGNVYLFAVEHFTDGTHSARFPVAVFTAGNLFFDFPTVKNTSFIVTGSEDTQITAEPISDLAKPEEIQKLTDLFKQTAGALYFKKEFRNTTAVSSDPETEYEKNKELYSSSLVWITASDGCISFSGIPVSGDSKNGRFPIYSHHSVYFTKPGKIQYVDTSFLITEGTIEKNLSLYIQSLAEQICSIRKEAGEKEKKQSIDNQYHSDQTYSTALHQIVSVISQNSSINYDLNTDSLLLKAAYVIAQKQSMQIKGIPGKQYEDTAAGIQELAKDNNIRYRKITLKDKWWKRDNGALLVFLQKDDQTKIPAVLIPKYSGQYQLIDIEKNTVQYITEETAKTIDTSAFILYKPLPDDKITIKTLLLFCLPNIRTDLCWYVILGIVISLVGLLTPEMTRVFMDTLIPQAAKNQLLQLSFLVFMCTISSMAFSLIRSIAMLRMETKADFTMQAAVIDRLLKLPVPFFNKFTSGDLSERLMALTAIRSLLSGTVISGFMALVFCIIYLFQLFKYSSYLIKWGLLFSLIPIVLSVLIDLYNYKWAKEITAINGRISGMLLQFLTGITKIINTSSEKRAFSVWTAEFTKEKSCAYKSASAGNIFSTVSAIFGTVITIAFYSIFINAIKTNKINDMTSGQFMAFMSSFGAFQSCLLNFTSSITQSLNIIPLYKRAKPILLEQPEIVSTKPTARPLYGNIEVNHLSFRYNKDGPLVLDDVTMTVAPKEFVAVVGSSGSGKSTLLKIMLGFDKPESGTVYYDDQDISSCDIGSIRRQMGVVLQSSSLMQGTVFSNITGSTGVSMDDAWRAAEMAGLADDIIKMPMGMYTMVPTGGITLSGGQRQRLMIARAIVKHPAILFLDEATSALDNQTQAVVSRSLESMNVTRVVIAHRLSTIIHADRIYVLEGGRIRETGTYDELMKKNGIFASLAKRQQV